MRPIISKTLRTRIKHGNNRVLQCFIVVLITLIITSGMCFAAPDGDFTGKGKSDITDALMCLRMVVGLIQPTELDIAHGDVAPLNFVTRKPNGDGKLDIADALGILRHVVNLDTWTTTNTLASGDIITIAGGGDSFYYNGTSSVSVLLSSPNAVALDRVGNIYISAFCRILKVSYDTGIITTIAGNGTAGYSGDNGPAKSAIISNNDVKAGIVVDSTGNIYFTDIKNNRIRKVSYDTGIITTIAGNGTAGYSGDNGPATTATMDTPSDVALDALGNLYVADAKNNRIRKVSYDTGIITTIAGNGSFGYSGDNGPATSAGFRYPSGVVLDSIGNIYIADEDSNRIRKISYDTGIITTIAGNGSWQYSGDNGPATSASLGTPYGVTLDKAGNIYIADGGGSIRKVNSLTGIITTVAGNGHSGYSGDNGPATSANLYFPIGVAVDNVLNIYIADTLNKRIRVVLH